MWLHLAACAPKENFPLTLLWFTSELSWSAQTGFFWNEIKAGVQLKISYPCIACGTRSKLVWSLQNVPAMAESPARAVLVHMVTPLDMQPFQVKEYNGKCPGIKYIFLVSIIESQRLAWSVSQDTEYDQLISQGFFYKPVPPYCQYVANPRFSSKRVPFGERNRKFFLSLVFLVSSHIFF